MSIPFDLVGVGIGPFNLSLAALLEKATELRAAFFDRKPGFDWHPELMFSDSIMQTSYLKDLVTPADPTSPYSFLNYLVANRLFYPFVNTQRQTISRREFEQYCQWVAGQLQHRLNFNHDVRSVSFTGATFRIETDNRTFEARNLCLGTGLVPRVPDCARPYFGASVFHAKSPRLQAMDLEGKSLLIVGGGQTGIEVFRNALLGKWGRLRDVQLITQRKTLEPLDESAFTNEFFTPNYIDAFWNLDAKTKTRIVDGQKLASDGNTPAYLIDLYNDLYRIKIVEGDRRRLRLMACRRLTGFEASGLGYRATVVNELTGGTEDMHADVVVLCTGFTSALPRALEPLLPRIAFAEGGRFRFQKTYAIEWDGPSENKIYALNFSRYTHGIADPQTSLMAWRSAVIVNDLLGRRLYETAQAHPNFVDYGNEVGFEAGTQSQLELS